MPNLRQDSWRLKTAVVGVNPPPIKSWQSMSGGDLESEDTKTRPGGQDQQISLGGPQTRSDVTITRLHSTALQSYIVQWEQACGNASGWVSYTPLDGNSNPNGPTITLHGLLKSVKQTEKDADAQGKSTVSLTYSLQAKASISQ